jgi:hypothetical protein
MCSASSNDTARLGRTKAEFLLAYRHEPESIELKQRMESLHDEATQLGISIDDIDTAAFPILERSHFFVHNAIRPAPPVEDLSLHDILLAWCAIHAEGRLRVDTTPQVHLGTIGSWAEWSGSSWVAARKRSIQEKGVTCFEAHYHCSLPPGVEPRTQQDHDITRKYGRWISETEWAPPPDWSDDVKQIIARAGSLTCEAMSTHQILLAWRAIYADGGLRIDATRYVPGVFVSWSQWSGSAWVARLERKLREDHNSVASNPSLHLAFPPGWNVQTEADREIIRKYGKWVSETEWEPPLLPEQVEAGAIQQPKTSRRRWWWQRRSLV